MVLDTSLPNTQQYKVRTKVKWSNPGKGVAPSLQLDVVAIAKGAFWSPSTTVANVTYVVVVSSLVERGIKSEAGSVGRSVFSNIKISYTSHSKMGGGK